MHLKAIKADLNSALTKKLTPGNLIEEKKLCFGQHKKIVLIKIVVVHLVLYITIGFCNLIKGLYLGWQWCLNMSTKKIKVIFQKILI